MNPYAPPIVWTRPLHGFASGTPADRHRRLMGTVSILGVDFHVNAEEVHEIDGEQIPMPDPDAEGATGEDTFVEQIHEIGGEGRNKTVDIDGRHYLLVITPFND